MEKCNFEINNLDLIKKAWLHHTNASKCNINPVKTVMSKLILTIDLPIIKKPHLNRKKYFFSKVTYAFSLLIAKTLWLLVLKKAMINKPTVGRKLIERIFTSFLHASVDKLFQIKYILQDHILVINPLMKLTLLHFWFQMKF